MLHELLVDELVKDFADDGEKRDGTEVFGEIEVLVFGEGDDFSDFAGVGVVVPEVMW